MDSNSSLFRVLDNDCEREQVPNNCGIVGKVLIIKMNSGIAGWNHLSNSKQLQGPSLQSFG